MDTPTISQERERYVDLLAQWLAPLFDEPCLRRYLDPSNAIAPKPQSTVRVTGKTIWFTLYRIPKYYRETWDQNKWTPITVTKQATPERVKMVNRILKARTQSQAEQAFSATIEKQRAEHIEAAYQADLSKWLSVVEPVAQPAPLNLVYGISRWSNPNRAAARHIDDGSGYPLCGGDGRKAFSWETEQGTPTCAKCIALAQPEAVTA